MGAVIRQDVYGTCLIEVPNNRKDDEETYKLRGYKSFKISSDGNSGYQAIAEQKLSDWADKVKEKNNGIRVLKKEFVDEENYFKAVNNIADLTKRGLVPKFGLNAEPGVNVFTLYLVVGGVFPEITDKSGTDEDGLGMPVIIHIGKDPDDLTDEDFDFIANDVAHKIDEKYNLVGTPRTVKRVDFVDEEEYQQARDNFVQFVKKTVKPGLDHKD